MTTTPKTDLPGGSLDTSEFDHLVDDLIFRCSPGYGGPEELRRKVLRAFATLQAERDAAREERDQILAQAKDLEGRYIVEARSAAEARLRAEAAEAKLAEMTSPSPPLPEDLQTASAEADEDLRGMDFEIYCMPRSQALANMKFMFMACDYIRSLLPQQTGEVKS